jgi:NAD(P)-dependent dehydrogenase (short-subunit alcohol dehydrogenase family)
MEELMAISLDLSGKIAIVTGAGRGIGRSIALALAEAGADITVAARTLSEIDPVAEEIRARGRRSLAIATDITDANQVQAMVDETVETLGGVHILVNNAGGVSQRLPILEYPESLWDEVTDLNLKAVFLCTKAVGKYLVAQEYGKVINIASMGGIVVERDNASYHASKGAVILLTKATALEWARYHVNVNAVAPGVVMNDRFENLDEKRKERFTRAIPVKRFGQPEEIAHLVVFLASDLSQYMIGECVVIDGGLSIT